MEKKTESPAEHQTDGGKTPAEQRATSYKRPVTFANSLPDDMKDLEPFSLEMLEARPVVLANGYANGKGSPSHQAGPFVATVPNPKPLVADMSALEYTGPGQTVEPDQTVLRPEQAEALLTISALLNSDLNPGRVLGDMLKALRALFHADRAAVFLRQNLPVSDLPDQTANTPDNATVGSIMCAAALGLSQSYIKQAISFYETKEFRRLQKLRQPVFVADAQNEQSLNGVRELNRREGFQSMLTLPLLHRQVLGGLLVLYHDQKHDYAPQEVKLLTVFANQAALAISNARLYQETLRREREANLLAQASRAFNSSLKLREVLNEVVQAATTILGNTALVFILREGSDQAHPVAYYSKSGPSDNDLENKIPSPVRTQPPVRLGEGAIGKTIQTGVPFFIHTPKDVQRAAPFLRPQDNVQSLLCVPLKMRGRAIGALLSYSRSEQADHKPSREVGEHQLTLAQSLADRAAVAIENARLYQAEKREQHIKDEFLAFVAHELRTPLTSIKGYNRLLAKKLQTPGSQFQADPQAYLKGLQHYTEVMESQSERLHQLIQDLSSIGRIESGKLDVDLRSINLVELVRETVATFETELNTAQSPYPYHQINLRITRPIITGQFDSNAVGRILRNLLANAVKFSPKGSEIAVRLTQINSEAVLTVQDSGIGIPFQDQEQIFERFYKASSQSGRANGLGLGLYIARNLVEAHGGQIHVRSEEGTGSTFVVTFPLPSKEPKP